MAWPLSQDYNEAIQDPAASFSDADLKQGQAATNALGIPMPRSGNFADVYEVTTPRGKWATKCFTRQIPGLRERYKEVSAYLKQTPLPFMVEFTYLEQGIRVRGDWYPVLKMHWVEGFNLNQFVKDNLERPQLLDILCQIWVKLAARLREGQIAHCDLQHGNVLLVPGSKAGALAVKLVDYDGMCVPALTMLKTIEVGHPNFQHPQRAKEGIYSLEVDRFSHLVIYTAIRALMTGGKGLWGKYDNGDNLLFKASDFEKPTQSPLFAELTKFSDPGVQTLAGQMLDALGKPLNDSPALEELVPKLPATAPPKPKTSVKVTKTEDVFAQATTAGRKSQLGKKKKSLAGLAIAGVLGVLALIGAGVAAMFLMQNTDKPEAVVAKNELEPTKKGEPVKKNEPGKKNEPKSNPLEKKNPVVKVEPEPEPNPDPEPKGKPVAEPEPSKPITNSLGMKLVPVGAGRFTMGSSPREIERCIDLKLAWPGADGFKSQGPEHEVEITRAFYMGAHHVTVGQFQAFVTDSKYQGGGAWPRPAWEQTDEHPVVNVSSNDALAFCTWLSQKEGKRYRLPSEAEWEYCCRAGHAGSRYGFANEDSELALHAWYKANSKARTHPVGQLKANDWGLYDMHGNAWQWCQDHYGIDYYKSSPKQNPTGPNSDGMRVLRGGAWDCEPVHCGAAFRRPNEPALRSYNFGFRVVLEKNPSEPQAENLLAAVELPRHLLKGGAVAGTWKRTNDGLQATTPSDAGAMVEVPAETPPSYELHIDFTRVRSGESITAVVPVGKSRVQLWLDYGRAFGGLSLKEHVDPSLNRTKIEQKERLKDGVRHDLAIQVRIQKDDADIRATLDGSPYLSWKGKIDDLAVSDQWRVPASCRLAVGCGTDSTVVFHSARLVPISPEAGPKVEPAAQNDFTTFEGVWLLSYSSGERRALVIQPSGAVLYPDQWNNLVKARLERRGADVVLDLAGQAGHRDLDRIRAIAGKLRIDHFSPSSAYPNNPKMTAVGIKEASVLVGDDAEKKTGLGPFKGVWAVRFTDWALRVYLISPDGEIVSAESPEGGRVVRGKIVAKTKAVLIDFNDKTLERCRLEGDRLIIEHFDSPGKLDRVGVGERCVLPPPNGPWDFGDSKSAPLARVRYERGLSKARETLSAELTRAAKAEAKDARAQREIEEVLAFINPDVPAERLKLGKYEYQLIEAPATWHQAKQRCEFLGGQLVCIENRAENDLVVGLVGKSGAWIGATDEENEGDWRWVNGKPVVYPGWRPGEPNNVGGIEHHAFRPAGWMDLSAGPRIGFVCQWGAGPPNIAPIEIPLRFKSRVAQKAADAYLAAVATQKRELIKDLRKAFAEASDSGKTVDALRIREVSNRFDRPQPKGAQKLGTHRFLLIPEKATWHQARSICEAMGGHLAHVRNAAEWALVQKLWSAANCKEPVWLGGSDEWKEGEWRWTDGSRVTFSAWEPGQPDNTSLVEHHMCFPFVGRAGAGWNDAAAGFRYRFICEWDE
jgi:formylglycine-generating enzyme required for sulfatase activity